MTQAERFMDSNLPGTKTEMTFFSGLPFRTTLPTIPLQRRGRTVRILRGIAKTIKALFDWNPCPHANTTFPRVHEQKCLDCGKVRLLGTGFEKWHTEVR